MSLAYDEYLAEHISNVNKGLHWMLDNLFLSQEEKTAIETAMTEFNHDESKYSSEEYNAYDQYFYGGNRSYKVVQDFNYAWLHHIHQNPHHWQYWVLLEDDPEAGLPYKTLPIPLPYIFEMIADWWTFSWKEGNLFEIFNWYADHRAKQYIHPESREIVEYILVKIWNILIMQETIAGHDISEIEGQYKRFWVEQDVDLLNWDHPSVQVIGKVVNTRETENGLEVTVEHSGIKGQKWGVRNGPPYPLDSAKVAEKLYSDAEKKANRITKDVERAAKMAGGEMHGLENQLKTKESIERKLNKKVNEKGMDITEAANSIKDAIRYTVIAPTDNFVNMYYDFKDHMLNKGYFETSCDNYFDKFSKGEVKHKAIQSNFTDKDGYEFEVQFHTPESQDAKDKKLPLYNERRTTGISERRAKELEKQMENLALNIPDPEGVHNILSHGESEDDEDLYGVPELKKYPMPDKKHVKSAIRFFNYVDPKYEKELAEAILEKAEEFGLNLGEDINVGDENRFKKYIPENVLEHTGLKGMKWGIRRFQNYDGSLTEEGKARYGRPSKPVHYGNKNDPRFKQTIFVSGSSKTQNEDSQYYRKELPKAIREELDRYVKDGDTILVGDAPGIDRQVQDYLNSKNYGNVEVYGPGKNVRYSANKKWKTNPIDDPDHEEGSTEWLAKKDEAMAERASDGIAIILDEGAKATRKNVGRLADLDKNVSVFQLDKNGSDLDRWFDESELLDIMDTEVSKLYNN